MQTSVLNISQIIEQMQRLVPPGAPEPQDPTVLAQLQSLTKDLIQAYQASGRLQEDPFYEAATRPLYLYQTEVCQQLANKVVLVTGGEGYVGQSLIKQLVELGVKQIVSVDKARCSSAANTPVLCEQQAGIRFYAADIRNYEALNQVFEAEKPAIVFHLAAQRLPGLAEKLIYETITSNVFGTQNLIQLCEAHSVQQCVFSSTGKASRYVTAEVYAASKKMAEWLFAEAVQVGKVRYSMVRFTHMLENSAMCEQLEGKVNQNLPVNVHAPDRYVTAQNVGEAVHLLLNALVLSDPEQLKFLLVRNLGWPTESLEVALHKILQSGKDLPIYFQGVLPGYEESFFLGQVAWDDQVDVNTLINALETFYGEEVSSSGDMIVAALVPFSTFTLNHQLASLRSLCDDATTPEPALKQALAAAVKEITRSTFVLSQPQTLLKILRWGVNPKQFHRGELKLAAHQSIIELLVQSLCDRFSPEVVEASGLPGQEVQEMLEVLAMLPSIEKEVAQMQTVLQGNVERDRPCVEA